VRIAREFHEAVPPPTPPFCLCAYAEGGSDCARRPSLHLRFCVPVVVLASLCSNRQLADCDAFGSFRGVCGSDGNCVCESGWGNYACSVSTVDSSTGNSRYYLRRQDCEADGGVWTPTTHANLRCDFCALPRMILLPLPALRRLGCGVVQGSDGRTSPSAW